MPKKTSSSSSSSSSSSNSVLPPAMCRRRSSASATQPTIPSSKSRSSNPPSSSSSSTLTPSASAAIDNTTTTNSGEPPLATTTSSSSSLTSLRISLTQTPIFSFSEIASSTNNFLSKPFSSSSAWRCSLRGRETLVFHRPFHGNPTKLPSRLAAVCRSHHRSLVNIIGATLPTTNRIYLVYDFVQGASLFDCLHNPRNPNFTPLSTWISRIQIAADLAQGLDYIHHHSAGTGLIHNRIKSSSIIVTEPQINALICHFGAAYLSGDVPDDDESGSEWRSRRIEGTRGYLAPELIAGGSVSRRSDVFALGVVFLELISGEEAVGNKFDRERKDYRSSSVIEAAREVVGAAGHEIGLDEEESWRRRRIREWVDRRLKDSFPIEVVEKMMEIALRCVEVEAERRPSMTWVEGRVSKLFLESKAWGERIRVPTEISMSLAPR